MPSTPAEVREQRRLVIIAALAGIVGAVIAGGASYLATREANRAVIQRDERNEQLDARSAARLVDNELAVSQARLGLLRKEHLDAVSLAKALHKLPKAEWNANQQRLARTLTVHDWGYVSQAYVMTQAFASNVRPAVISDVTLGLLEKSVRDARNELLPYE